MCKTLPQIESFLFLRWTWHLSNSHLEVGWRASSRISRPKQVLWCKALFQGVICGISKRRRVRSTRLWPSRHRHHVIRQDEVRRAARPVDASQWGAVRRAATCPATAAALCSRIKAGKGLHLGDDGDRGTNSVAEQSDGALLHVLCEGDDVRRSPYHLLHSLHLLWILRTHVDVCPSKHQHERNARVESEDPRPQRVDAEKTLQWRSSAIARVAKNRVDVPRFEVVRRVHHLDSEAEIHQERGDTCSCDRVSSAFLEREHHDDSLLWHVIVAMLNLQMTRCIRAQVDPLVLQILPQMSVGEHSVLVHAILRLAEVVASNAAAPLFPPFVRNRRVSLWWIAQPRRTINSMVVTSERLRG